ncbi:HET-domain-containing protein [Mollisia scopiformis]|uniref:HET-domain-containing protein n=1 Tax=Mollisia scopiformis TaxID=149040 RepID=A0A194XW20_MOLSC|nr:HET-domain-containing protein [Mollisia scopiformis]KUJ24428.1 HET-domain-containing protein [Mollisia scopiformis]
MPQPRTYSLDYGIAALYLAGLIACCFAIYISALLFFPLLTILSANWLLIITIVSGLIAYFQVVKNPWKNLLYAYLEFRKIDLQVRGFRDRIIFEEIGYRFVTTQRNRWLWELYRILPNFKARPELPPTATTYEYEPICGSRSIRLLKILKWTPTYGVRAELEEMSLDNTAQYYTAISYCWGDPLQRLKTRIITLKGHDFAVSQNVYDILEHHSSIHYPVYIWIDSICINQEDLLERNQQVTFMREIYQHARNVIMWLGATHDAHLAIFLLNKVYNDKCLGMSKETMHDNYGEVRHTRPWLALGKLFRNPYFDRVWVIQEVASASSIIVLYDGKFISWTMLLQMMKLFSDTHLLLLFGGAHEGNYLVRKKPPAQEIVHGLSMARFQEKIQSGEGATLKDVVTWTTAFEATEPKDQVFALVGITEDRSHPLLVPDYRKSTLDVFRDMTLYLLRSNDPFILAHAGCGHPSSVTDLPSWVPDFTHRIQPITHGTDFKSYAASRNTKASIITQPTNPNILKVSCSIIDTIAHLGTRDDPYYAYKDPNCTTHLSSFRPTFNKAHEAKALATKHAPDPYHTGQPLSEALWRAAIGDKTLTERPAPAEYATYYEAVASRFSDPAKLKLELQVLEQGLQNPDPAINLAEIFSEDYMEKGKMATKYWAMASLVSVGKTFCVTGKGYIGWVPNGSKIGDSVSLVYGAQTPFVMRRYEGNNESTAGNDQDFLLVGACYLHGMMDGEGSDLSEKRKVKYVVLH